MTDKPVVVVLSPWYAAAMAELDQHFTVHKLWEASDKAALLASVRDTCVGIAGRRGCGAATMDALQNAKVIAQHGVGYDGVDAECF